MKNKPLIYIAGPYTIGNCVVNTRRAVMVGLELVARGYCVHVPHCNLLWDLIADVPKTYDTILEQDLAILRRCDALFRLKGESHGADIEERTALDNCIPVFREDDGDLECL